MPVVAATRPGRRTRPWLGAGTVASAPSPRWTFGGRFAGPLTAPIGEADVETGPVCRGCGLARFRRLSDDELRTAGAGGGFVGFLVYGWAAALVRLLGSSLFLPRIRRLAEPGPVAAVGPTGARPMDPATERRVPRPAPASLTAAAPGPGA